jgi:ubiquinone/menaquinone biosynthesis C-methylase UbiE
VTQSLGVREGVRGGGTKMKDRISESVVIEDRSLAEYYSRMAKRHMRIPCERVLKRVKAKGIERGMALDVGTGPGVFPIFLSKALPGFRFKGIDLSTVMVELAKKNAEEEALGSRVEFEVGSAYSLPCEDHSVDLILCINTLHHMDRPPLFFDEVARSLKVGGAFVIVDFHRDTSPVLLGIFNLLWKIFFGDHHQAKESFLESVRSSYTVKECRTFLEQSKLRDWNLYTRTIEMWIESTNSKRK